jgi:hypothetical protein
MGKKNKPGRPTIASNMLLGARDAWIFLLEEAWPEIGWPMICIRNQRTSTIEDVQKAMVILKDKPNGGLATRFYRDSFERASPSEIRRNWKSISRLDGRILEMQGKRDTQEHLCREAELALNEAEQMLKDEDPTVREKIQLEISRRRKFLVRMTEDVRALESGREALYRKVLDQESYFCRSELLDFLQSRRYAVKPRPLGNALAGLAYMRWRQSHSRCSPMPYSSEAHLWYRTWDAIRKIWKRNGTEFVGAPIEFFRTSILKIPKKRSVRQFLCKNWRDLRLAIEESWDPQYPSEGIPFKLTARFVQSVNRPKNSVEAVLAAQEKLG